MSYVLVVFLMATTPSMTSVNGFANPIDCDRAGLELQKFAKANHLPEVRWTCSLVRR
jgi:hypothetical protein